jgi:flagellar biogenesis protein FliO
VAQLFENVPALHELAPTGKEAPFGVAQLCLLVLFVIATIYAVKKFRLETMPALKRAA